MKNSKVFAILFLFVLLVQFSSARAETPLRISEGNDGDSGCDLVIANFDSIEEFTTFFSKLKDASKEKNATKISDAILFPLGVNVGGKRITLKKPSEFLSHFQEVWSKAVSSALASQEVSKLFCNYQGVMIGNGQIWIKKIKGKIGIGAINP